MIILSCGESGLCSFGTQPVFSHEIERRAYMHVSTVCGPWTEGAEPRLVNNMAQCYRLLSCSITICCSSRGPVRGRNIRPTFVAVMEAAIAFPVWPEPVRWVALPLVSDRSYTKSKLLTATLSRRQRSHFSLTGRACLDDIVLQGCVQPMQG